MGTWSSKPKQQIIEPKFEPKSINNELPTLKGIIKQYEYIKNTKKIHNIDTILAIVKNTDWDKINLDNTSENPSAPPLVIAVPIK